MNATYVQAWHVTGPTFNGYVYSQSIALDKLASGNDFVAVTIVRHANGDREYLRGCLANSVRTHRESASATQNV